MTNAHVDAGRWQTLESSLPAILDVIRSPLAVLSTELVFLAVNAAYTDVTGRPQEQIIGRNVFEVFPENPATRDDEAPSSLRRSLETVLETGEVDTMPLLRYDVEEDDVFEPRYWHITNVPVLDDDGGVRYVLNNPEELTEFIDERLRLEADRPTDATPAPAQAYAVADMFTTAVDRLQSLNDLASSLVGASDPAQVAAAVLRDGLAMVGATAGTMVTLNADRLEIVDSFGIDADMTAEWQSFTIEGGRDPFSDVFIDGEPLFFENRASFVGRYPAHADVVDTSGHDAWAVLPLAVDGAVTGAIGVVFDEPNEFDTPSQLVLHTLASLTSQAASRARLLADQALALASIEVAFEPRLDVVEGLQVSHLYRASTVATDAGGDWYDLIDLGNDSLLLAVGDVANHGAVAVGEMVRVRSTVHTLAHLGLGPAEIADEASTVLAKMASTFTTCVLALLDPKTLELRWANAGHPHPLIVSADGGVDDLVSTKGPPLGTGFEHTYESEQRRLRPGDTLVLYTDGLIERPDTPLDAGLAALRGALADHCPGTAELADRLFAELHPAEHQRDDIAILTVRICPNAAAAAARAG